MIRSLLLAALTALVAACPAPARSTLPKPPPPDQQPPATTEPGDVPPGTTPDDVPPDIAKPRVTWKKLESPDEVPSTPPPAGTYRIHMIDVGTGLAILVQGHEFNLLYDAGTGDPAEKPLRVVSYLAAALGTSGDDTCVPKGAARPQKRIKLDHVVLSHPHLDHGSAMDLVVHCFDVQHVWDSGRINEAVFYKDFLEAVGRSKTARYHTAADVPAGNAVTVKKTTIKINNWERFSEGDAVHLGEGARFTILHAEAKAKSDPNQNSVVLAVDLGGTRLLLTGDAESGDRKDPSEPVGDIEEFLIIHHQDKVRADILQVGHHGSKTSSRRDFLEAVKPKLALVSAGPKKYHDVVLPDAEVLAELRRLGAEVLRTDERDASCPLSRRIGGDSGPGGCDSYVITIESPQR